MSPPASQKHSTRRLTCIAWGIALMLMLIGTVARSSHSEEVPEMLIYQESDGVTSSYAVLVDKESQELLLYAFGHETTLLKRMKCSTGENPGPKKTSGDKKTPEGVYFFTGEHLGRDIAPIYGSRAFPLDYPNFMDRAKGLGGSDIWLHGTNKPLKDRNSNGCIVLNNSDIDAIGPLLGLKRTPIVIGGRIRYRDAVPQRELSARIRSFLEAWRHALEQGEYHDYLTFYASDYMPRMEWWNEWNRMRVSLKDVGKTFQVRLSRKAVCVYDNVFVALFDQELTIDGDSTPAGTRELFFREHENGFRIIGDRNQPFDRILSDVLASGELLKTARMLLAALQDGEHDIRRMIDDWLDAWASMDIKRYGDHYADDFSSRGMDRNAWIEYKNRLNRQYSFIRVKQEDLKVGKSGNQRDVSFIQTYESDSFNTRGLKRLVLKKQDGAWKIHRETWENI